MSDSTNNTMVSSKHNSIPHIASSRLLTPSSSERSVYELFEIIKKFLPTSLFACMLITVVIFFVLAFVFKPRWISLQLTEKFRLHMAGPMVGDFKKGILSATDEKDVRLLHDMSSSSSTSLSPSVLPTHNASPGLYKKTSRRPSSRQKSQPTNIPASSLSPIEDDMSSTVSSIDSHSEQSSTITEQDEIKTSVTINVADTLNSRTVPSSVDACQENKDKIDNNALDPNSSDKIEHKIEKLETDQGFIQDDNISSWTESQSTPTAISNRDYKSRRLTADIKFSESSLPSTNNGSPKLQQKNSNSPMKGYRKHNIRNKDQESDGEIDSIISDDHSEQSLIQQTGPIVQKHVQCSTQEETFVKTGNRRRRRRRGSKNNQLKTQQNQQTQISDQRSLKQEQPISQKQDVSSSEMSKSRHHHSNEIPRSRQVVEKPKAVDYDIWERHSHQHTESHQPSRSDQSAYFLQSNKRNGQIYNPETLNGTAIPAKATLSESNRKSAGFSRADVHLKQNVLTTPSVSSSNVPISRYTTYADVISPQNRPSAITNGLSRSNTSRLSNGNDIMTPVPAASMNNAINSQWYSPFVSGLSIQLTPPASPQNMHRQLPHTTNTSNSMYSSKQSHDRSRNVIAPPPPISAPNSVSSLSSSPSSSLSIFSSSPFSSLSNSFSNQNQNNVITSPINSSFRESIFGRKHPVQDQEKGELSDDADDSECWNKITGISDLKNQRNTWVGQNKTSLRIKKGEFGEETKSKSINENREQQQSQQQFSLFDKRFSFMYPPKS
ncbi:10780_t:CDS:2 [Funneliformis geosporum]|uniref:10780_t:CDS:1 n=1 Tax=Funneliformis geosporum TaxID=1117311 RepID=A0A9W4X1P7_9GLOM|nr:10780_t:CDS:2 [Funneliformis geosporum]